MDATPAQSAQPEPTPAVVSRSSRLVGQLFVGLLVVGLLAAGLAAVWCFPRPEPPKPKEARKPGLVLPKDRVAEDDGKLMLVLPDGARRLASSFGVASRHDAKCYAYMPDPPGRDTLHCLVCSVDGKVKKVGKAKHDDLCAATGVESARWLGADRVFVQVRANPSLGFGVDVDTASDSSSVVRGALFVWNPAVTRLARVECPPHGAAESIPAQVFVGKLKICDVPNNAQPALAWSKLTGRTKGEVLEVKFGDQPIARATFKATGDDAPRIEIIKPPRRPTAPAPPARSRTPARR